jgi:glycerate kinase
MKILLAPDKFRGSLTATEVAKAMQKGCLLAKPEASIEICELADGGEGTVELLLRSLGGTLQSVQVQDPLGRTITAHYGLSAKCDIAFIEMSSASGLALLAKEEQNPCLTSTYGTGQLIQDAIQQGVQRIYLGIGGSATTDGGIGMAAALGYAFLDKNGQAVEPIGGNLKQITHIDDSQVHPLIHQVSFTVLSDVNNPLIGPMGAAAVYGPQKGATSDMVILLNEGLAHLNAVVTQWSGKDIASVPGAGAAGGVGAGALWFLNAQLRSGVQTLIDLLGIQDKIQAADLVITGEGKIDSQTLQGKVIGGLASICHASHTPLVVVSGAMLLTPSQIQDLGITAAVSIMNRPVDESTAYKEAFDRVVEATFNLVRLFSYSSI